MRTYNGLEYEGIDFTKMLKNCGIKREHTIRYTPQQNRKAERMSRTLMEIARSLSIESKLRDSFWTEVVQTANYIRNRCLQNP